MLQQVDQNVNHIREAALVEELSQAVGNRILILIEPYPFFLVGELVEVRGDTIFVLVELSNIPEFDNINVRVHIDDIQVYFVETPDNPIPEIRL
ncbi:hypothetical protein M3231_04050 [Neobacillus mesonae]|nr:hypothetical protein [Neobacillus mesonae]